MIKVIKTDKRYNLFKYGFTHALVCYQYSLHHLQFLDHFKDQYGTFSNDVWRRTVSRGKVYFYVKDDAKITLALLLVKTT